MKQETRHRAALVGAWGGWLTATGLTALRVTDQIGQAVGIVIVLFIGVAIACGMTLSRMRLSATIVATFQAGILAAEQRAQSREDRTELRADEREQRR